MRRTKLITLLVVPFLLTGCDTDLSKISQPRFADVGSQVSYDDFENAYNEAFEVIDINSEELLKSKELTFKSGSVYKSGSYVNRSTSVRKIVTLNEKIQGLKETSTVKYDARKSIILTKSEEDYLAVNKDQTGTVKETSTTKQEMGVAVVKIDDGKSAISFNNKTMTYNVNKAFGEGENPTSYIDMQFRMGCLISILMPFTSYLPQSEEEFVNYSFFKNGNILTYTNNSETREYTKDAEDNELYVDTYQKTIKVQLDLEKNKQSIKYYIFTEAVREYSNAELKAQHHGAYDKESIETAAEISVKTKSISLKSIKISKYDAVE